jgi:16S rRNA (guanine966-N2)-methyltransferase
MRVIAGVARSLKLITPEGNNTRPTADRIKETLFNVIQNEVPASIFVDLFSGSGGIGVEALSRGANKAYFIDTDKEAIRCIETNLKHTKLFDKAMVLKQDAITAVSYSIKETADIIFADPPYGQGFDQTLLAAIKSSKVANEDTLIIIEEEKNTDFSYAEDLGFDIIKEKVYKTNKHVFLKKRA